MDKKPILASLDPEQLDALNALAVETQIPRAVLIREAIDGLLSKRLGIEWKRSRGTNPPRAISSARKAAKSK